MQGKVEIYGVNIARLKVLSQKEMDQFLLQAKDGAYYSLVRCCTAGHGGSIHCGHRQDAHCNRL